MYQNQLINAVILWERRLEIEESQRNAHVYRSRPEMDSLTPFSSAPGSALDLGEKSSKKRTPFARGLRNQAEDLTNCCMSDPCQKSQLV